MIALLRKNIIPLVNFFELSAVIVIIILALCIQLIVHELPARYVYYNALDFCAWHMVF